MPLQGDAKRAYQRQWLANRRQEWIADNGPCAKCGNNIDLEIDHKDRNTKTLNPSRLWSLAATNPVRIGELAKCQVLCSACHLEKTKKESAIPITHGHYHKGYGRGCRCAACMASVAPRWREHRLRGSTVGELS